MIAAGPAHAAALAAIHAAAFPPGEAWREADFAAQLRLPGVAGLIHPQGGLILIRVAADEAEVLTLGVVPPARRRGIGCALLKAAMKRASVGGAKTIFLEVAETNTPALALYDSLGLTKISRRLAYYPGGGHAVILSHCTELSVVTPRWNDTRGGCKVKAPT